MSKHKNQRIEFFRQKEFQYKFFRIGDQYGVKNINDAKYKIMPLSRNEIEFIIEHYLNDNQNK